MHAPKSHMAASQRPRELSVHHTGRGSDLQHGERRDTHQHGCRQPPWGWERNWDRAQHPHPPPGSSRDRCAVQNASEGHKSTHRVSPRHLSSPAGSSTSGRRAENGILNKEREGGKKMPYYLTLVMDTKFLMSNFRARSVPGFDLTPLSRSLQLTGKPCFEWTETYNILRPSTWCC